MGITEALFNRPESGMEKMEKSLEFREEETKEFEETEEESESEEEEVVEEEEEEEFLFPRELDFTEVCSCHECCAKINALKEFEKDFVCKLNLVENCWIQFIVSKDRCRRLAYNIEDLVILFEMLQDNLKKVHKDLGFSSIFEGCNCSYITRLKDDCDCIWVYKLKNVYKNMNIRLFGETKIEEMKMNIMLVYHEPYGEKGTYEEGGTEEEVRAYRTDTIRKKIDYLLFLYTRTRKMEEAHELLNKILDIENQQEHDRNFIKELDPFISKMCIENQIELLKKLPFEVVEREMNEVLDKMSPYEENVDMLGVVRNSISKTRRRMFLTSSEFLNKYTEINCNVKGHDLSGLEITLDSLSNQMKLFNDLWKKDYFPSIAHIITICQQAEAEGFCPQGLCSSSCPSH